MDRIIILLLIIGGLFGCDDAENTIIDRLAPEIIKEYINNSGVDIEIITYNDDDRHSYKIANTDTITLSFCANRRNLKHDKNFMFRADSIKVIYNEERISRMSYPLLISYPTITDEISKRGYVHAEPFTFTREMYDAATPIDQ